MSINEKNLAPELCIVNGTKTALTNLIGQAKVTGSLSKLIVRELNRLVHCYTCDPWLCTTNKGACFCGSSEITT